VAVFAAFDGGRFCLRHPPATTATTATIVRRNGLWSPGRNRRLTGCRRARDQPTA